MTEEEKARAKEARRKYDAEYRKKNREKLRAYKKEWRAKNPDKCEAAQVRYWEKKFKEMSEDAGKSEDNAGE